ncbi:MAG: hypothetical protein H0W68_14400 [Gemmatimonadaceae bacterium]|nr:hypothetical protein [Gemmatimonadaceae bacterium]
MSNATPLMLGLAGGLALWRLAPSKRPALRNASAGTCVILLGPNGVAIDGEVVEVDEAVRRVQLVGLAVVSVAPDAPASLYAALSSGLRLAGVATHWRTTGSTRNGDTGTFSAFTLVTYPEGVGGSRKHMSWFRTDTPMTWRAARDQLATANLIDPAAIAPKQAGYWKLVSDPRVFMPMRAKRLPAPKRHRDAARTKRYALEGGRVIVRDGQPLVRLERVDLGDVRYALSPHETDELSALIVRLLNRRGAR